MLPLALIPGGTEMLVIVGLLVLLFGATKLPKIAQSVGGFKANLRKGQLEAEREAAEAERAAALARAEVK